MEGRGQDVGDNARKHVGVPAKDLDHVAPNQEQAIKWVTGRLIYAADNFLGWVMEHGIVEVRNHTMDKCKR